MAATWAVIRSRVVTPCRSSHGRNPPHREVIFAGDLDPAPILDDIIDLADEQKVTIREILPVEVRVDDPHRWRPGCARHGAALAPDPIEDLLEPERDGTPPFCCSSTASPIPATLARSSARQSVPASPGSCCPATVRHITPTVAKTAAGAVEHLRMSVVGGLPSAMKTLSQRGIWTVGLDAGASSIFDLPVADEPIALVLGAEGPGLSRLVRERCDTIASIRWPACSTVSMSRTPQRFRSTRSPVVALRRRVETEPRQGSNLRPAVYKTAALPTELHGRGSGIRPADVA